MQPTPFPRSTTEAPEFFLTTPLDFFATSTDQTPVETFTGSYFAVRKSKKTRPDAALGSSRYQDFLPAASNCSTFAATGRSSFFMRATLASTPAASQSSKGPSFQLKPNFIARSISTTVSEISGMRSAEYVHRSDKVDHRNAPALSPFCGPPSSPSNIRTRAPGSSTFFAISRAGNFAFLTG